MEKPKEGVITFDSEGTEGGLFHSRKLHVPTISSGLTIGRGYDMRFKTAMQIENDLKKAGVSKEDAKLLSKAKGLFGQRAKEFIKKHKLENYEISKNIQIKLFEITYKEEEAETKRLCTKSDVEQKFGKCDWEKLNPAMKQILVDLKYRGDYRPETREKFQKIISDNDVEGFLETLKDKKLWHAVPPDRFNKRVRYYENNYKSKK